MDSQNLKTFCTVISEGSMTAAAAKLNITQPAVSQQIRQLEILLGTKLLIRNRTARNVKPTIQGQILFESANKVLGIIQQTKHAIQAISFEGSEPENLNVFTLSSIGMYLISPIITNFLKPNKFLELSLSYAKGADVIKKIQQDEADAVIMPDIKQEYGKVFPQYKKIHLFKDSMYFIGSGKDMNLPKSISFKDLKEMRLVKVSDHFPAFNNLLNQKDKDQNLNLQPSFTCNNIGTVKRVIENELGCGFLPAHSIRKQLRSGRLVAINIEDFDYHVDINLYCKVNDKKGKFIDILKSLIQQQARSTF